MKITTKKGDKGETSLYNGKIVSKASSVIEVLGSLDELQAVLGICRCKIVGEKKKLILRIQKDLYRIMAIVGKGNCPKKVKPIGALDVKFLEKEINTGEKICGDICEFIIPGDNEISAYLNFARTVCRRAERDFVMFGGNGEILKYLNRLSDLLFIWTIAKK